MGENSPWVPCRFRAPNGKGRIRITPDLLIADIRVEEMRIIIVSDRETMAVKNRRISRLRALINLPLISFLIAIASGILGNDLLISFATGLLIISTLIFVLAFVPLLFLWRIPSTKVVTFSGNADRPISFEIIRAPKELTENVKPINSKTLVHQSPLNMEWTAYDPLIHGIKLGAAWSFVVGLFLLLAVLVAPLSSFALLLAPTPLAILTFWSWHKKRIDIRTIDPQYVSAFRNICTGQDAAARSDLTELLTRTKDAHIALVNVFLHIMDLQLHRAAEICADYDELAVIRGGLLRILSSEGSKADQFA